MQMTTLNLQSSQAKTEESEAGIVPGSAEAKTSTTTETDGTEHRMHFSEWWSEYQEKMKTGFQGNSLKLQFES